MGEPAKMNTLTIKAKSLLAANKIVQMVETWSQKKNVPLASASAKENFNQGVSDLIELTFSDVYPKGSVAPMFAMAPFSSVVGCSIYRIGDPGKIICLVPPQGPADLFVEVFAGKPTESAIDHIKTQTERTARLILQALNGS